MTEDTGAMRVKLWRCPECGFTANDADAWTSYCPSCGDEERDPEPVEALIVPPNQIAVVLDPNSLAATLGAIRAIRALGDTGLPDANEALDRAESQIAAADPELRAALTEEGS